MTINPTHRFRKSRCITDLCAVLILARVEAECLFVYVPEEMERLNRNVCTVQLPFQQRPEVLNSVGVNGPVHIVLKVVDDLLYVVSINREICRMLVCVQNRASVNMIEDRIAECRFLAVWYDFGADLAVALQHAHDNRLAPILFAAILHPHALVFVHVPRLATYEGFIHLDFGAGAAKFYERLFLKRKPKALKHKPCRLLCDTKRAVNLHTGDSVLAINQHPKGNHPLIQAERRILKDRVDLQSELLIAATAEPEFPRTNKVVLLGAATRADDLAIRPAQLAGVLESAIRIGEVNDRFL